ncbi:hypothetical protein EPN42_12450 [bacterium]|nr:MAG: hypothetical protein EPN42_12450 [bacterium]
MRGMARTGWFASIAVFATLLGHAAAYLCEGRDLSDGRHAYFMPALDLALAALLAGAMLVALRALSVRARTGLRLEAPPFQRQWLALATVQVGGFVALETMEGHRADLAGCAIEVLVALLVAVALTSFCGLMERCAAMNAAIYLRRYQGAGMAAARHSVPAVAPALSLTTCAGVRRFKRPPPIG